MNPGSTVNEYVDAALSLHGLVDHLIQVIARPIRSRNADAAKFLRQCLN